MEPPLKSDYTKNITDIIQRLKSQRRIHYGSSTNDSIGSTH